LADAALFEPDIFLSYAREDEARARELATALGQRGFSVFWDREVPPGQTWHSYIGEALANARCVVVAWSCHSIVSDWVIEEANEGKRRRILVPVLFEAVQPPFGFGGIQAASLIDWRPGRSSPAFDRLLDAVQWIGSGQGESLASVAKAAPSRAAEARAAESTAKIRRARSWRGSSASRGSKAKAVPPDTNPGRVVFNPAERMKVGQRERIEVRLSRDLAAKLTEGLRGRGAPRIEAIEIADRMRVRLLGEEFVIKALSSEDQVVREVGVAQWDFDVVPVRRGRKVLRLLVTLRLKREDTQELYDLPALEREVVVQVAPVYAVALFTRTHWQWLVASIFIPLAVWLVSGADLVDRANDYLTRVVHLLSAVSLPGERREPMRDCPECPEMVLVPAGEFKMGSPGEPDWEGPQRQVTIAQPFWVGKYEVTFAEWDAWVAAGGCNKPNDAGWGRGNRPVINVSWNDAKEYVGWLSRTTGKTYRLLSEAEWEYVARAGSTTAFWWGDDVGQNKANCHGCGSKWDGKSTAPVGSFAENSFGLHDTAGNVWEWVEDCYHDSYDSAPKDSSAWLDGDDCSRVLRGGSWNFATGFARSASRFRVYPGYRDDNDGFRVARAPD
jgi:formylglycine-generating enzyme required for sulfatase activity